jgi:Family of unknown function (DUF5317)
MKLAVVALVIGVLAGLVAGGSFSNLAVVRVRLGILAVIGLGLQVLPVPGHVLPLALLYTSFALLVAFAVLNRRVAGIPLIIVGIALNLAVIGVNGGIPVSRSALIASGQRDTLTLLINDGGAKHHLATSDDVLLPLADVIPIRGVDQVVSVGDLATYAGIIWFMVASMRRRPHSPVHAMLHTREAHAGG